MWSYSFKQFHNQSTLVINGKSSEIASENILPYRFLLPKLNVYELAAFSSSSFFGPSSFWHDALIHLDTNSAYSWCAHQDAVNAKCTNCVTWWSSSSKKSSKYSAAEAENGDCSPIASDFSDFSVCSGSMSGSSHYNFQYWMLEVSWGSLFRPSLDSSRPPRLTRASFRLWQRLCLCRRQTDVCSNYSTSGDCWMSFRRLSKNIL